MGGHCVFVHTVWAIVMINCCFTANELRVTVSLCECLYSLSGLPLEDSGGHSNDPPVHPMNPLNSMKPSLPPNPQRYTHTNTHAAADEGLRPQVTPHLRSTVTSLFGLIRSLPVPVSATCATKAFFYSAHRWQMWRRCETAVLLPNAPERWRQMKAFVKRRGLVLLQIKLIGGILKLHGSLQAWTRW